MSAIKAMNKKKSGKTKRVTRCFERGESQVKIKKYFNIKKKHCKGHYHSSFNATGVFDALCAAEKAKQRKKNQR